jgi:hypothetical protein
MGTLRTELMHWHGAEWAFGQGIVVDGLRVGAVTPRHMRSQQQRHCLPGEERRPETVPCVVQLVHTQACKCMMQSAGGGVQGKWAVCIMLQRRG